MIIIAARPRSSAYLASRWLRTGGNHARADAPSRGPNNPPNTTFNGLTPRSELPLATIPSTNRISSPGAPVFAASASAKSP
jgi:hypothetical protein